jgi:hypothetical protein
VRAASVSAITQLLCQNTGFVDIDTDDVDVDHLVCTKQGLSIRRIPRGAAHRGAWCLRSIGAVRLTPHHCDAVKWDTQSGVKQRCASSVRHRYRALGVSIPPDETTKEAGMRTEGTNGQGGYAMYMYLGVQRIWRYAKVES